MQENQTIPFKCPKCQVVIDVNEALYKQIELENQSRFLAQQKEFEKEVKEKRAQYQSHFKMLEQKEEVLKEREKEQKAKFDDAVKQASALALQDERAKIIEEARKNAFLEQQKGLELLQKELDEKSKQVQELHQKEAEIEKLKRENNEAESRLKAENEKKLNEKLETERERIEKALHEKNELKFKQQEEQLEMLRNELKNAQRKAELSSQQFQGEVQELAIEEFLRQKFPLDCIEEIKKGQRGGDCIQVVHTREFQNCGKIYYESKRTKEFQKAWVEKLKSDMREIGADVGVIVSEALPKEMERMGLFEGVWVCSFEEFKGLSTVLREGVIQVSLAKKSQENKGDKVNLLYHYLTSSEFSMQVNAIIEGFEQLRAELEKEKNAMARIWKSREKQMEKVFEGTINMYGSIKGIMGNTIGQVKALELGYDGEDLED
ncbi:Caldesmon [Helicobacter pylori]|nr:Caldesmon [Helicobacter pylori]